MATTSPTAEAIASLSLSMAPRHIPAPGPVVIAASTVVPHSKTAILAARAEFGCLFGLLMLVIALRTRLTIARALRSLDRSTNLWLLLHIFISFFEVGRLQWRALGCFPVHPTVFDLALGLVHCLSSYQVLLQRTRAGYKDLIPLGLRLQPFFFRVVVTALAYGIESPALHRANVRLGFDSFLYARLFIFSLTKVSSIGLGPRTLHTSAAVLGGFVATYNAGVKFGSLAYVICSAISILLDRRTARFMASLSNTTTTATPDTVDEPVFSMAPMAMGIPAIVRSYYRSFNQFMKAQASFTTHKDTRSPQVI